MNGRPAAGLRLLSAKYIQELAESMGWEFDLLLKEARDVSCLRVWERRSSASQHSLYIAVRL
jgi:hypothetical protein